MRNNTATTTAGTVARTSGDNVADAISSQNPMLEDIRSYSKKTADSLENR